MSSKPAPRTSSDRREQSRLALVHAAQKLFAADSIDGVSLREIAAAAGHGNLNAVQYHFGDKQGLIRAVYQANIPSLEHLRSARLAQCAKEDGLGDLGALIDVLYRPFLEHLDREGRHSYAAFNLQVQTSMKWRPSWEEFVDSLPVTLVIARLISNLMDDMPEAVLTARMRYASSVVLQMCVELDTASNGDEATRAATIDDAFGAVRAICGAPYAPLR